MQAIIFAHVYITLAGSLHGLVIGYIIIVGMSRMYTIVGNKGQGYTLVAERVVALSGNFHLQYTHIKGVSVVLLRKNSDSKLNNTL